MTPHRRNGTIAAPHRSERRGGVLSESSNAAPPLAGVRVVELATVLAGPGIGVALGDQGADVVKVEPYAGDPIRGYSPTGQDAWGFVAFNRNKRSIAVDLRHPKGKRIVEQLIEGADVVTENFRPGVLEKQGITYEAMREKNRRLIWVSVTGYGHSGPYVDRRGYDLVAQAQGGTLSYRHFPDGTPMTSGLTLADISTSLFGMQGVLLALYKREQTGEGQRVDVTLLNSIMSFQGPRFLVPDPRPSTPMIQMRHIPWQTPYRCGDGKYIFVALLVQKEWADLCRALELEHIIDDPRHAFPPESTADELSQLMAGVFETRSSDEWLERLLAADVPAGIINTIEEAVEDPHARATGMVFRMNDPRRGAYWVADAAVHLQDNPPRSPMAPAPIVGEHSNPILRELGYSDADIDALVAERVVRRAGE
jgi:crotonobetainyl-CoA:carnitine CoA-transferase CaiB-like acyl-CoA transferase